MKRLKRLFRDLRFAVALSVLTLVAITVGVTASDPDWKTYFLCATIGIWNGVALAYQRLFTRGHGTINILRDLVADSVDRDERYAKQFDGLTASFHELRAVLKSRVRVIAPNGASAQDITFMDAHAAALMREGRARFTYENGPVIVDFIATGPDPSDDRLWPVDPAPTPTPAPTTARPTGVRADLTPAGPAQTGGTRA